MYKVPYIKKQVNAGTEYRKMNSSDQKWILSQAKKLSDIAIACDRDKVEEGMPLNTPNPLMPRMSTGKRNTPGTICSGVLDNFNKGQYDLTGKQCDGLQEAFRIGCTVIEGFEEVEFEEVTTLPKIQQKVQEPEVNELRFEVIVRQIV